LKDQYSQAFILNNCIIQSPGFFHHNHTIYPFKIR